jgi:hypothetical protein
VPLKPMVAGFFSHFATFGSGSKKYKAHEIKVFKIIFKICLLKRLKALKPRIGLHHYEKGNV